MGDTKDKSSLQWLLFSIIAAFLNVKYKGNLWKEADGKETADKIILHGHQGNRALHRHRGITGIWMKKETRREEKRIAGRKNVWLP